MKQNYLVCMSGLGLGLNSLSGHVMVNSYFNERRGLAGGIVSSGAGFGVFVLAPLLQFLVQRYAWRGAVLILSGIVLHFCVFATLMRPLKSRADRMTPSSLSTDDEDADVCELSDNNTKNVEVKNQTQPFIPKHSNYEHGSSDLRKHVMSKALDSGNGISYLSSRNNGRSTNGHFLSSYDVNPNRISEKDIRNLNSLPDLSKYPSKDDESGAKHNRHRHPIHLRHHAHHHRHGATDPFLRKDVYFTSSLHHLKEYRNADSTASFVHSMIITTTEADDNTYHVTGNNTALHKIVRKKPRTFDFSIFCNSVYIPMLLGGVFIQMGQFIPSTFIPEYATQLGLTKDQISVLFSIFGE